MSGALRIRLAGPDDLAAVGLCAQAAFAPYVPVIGRPPAPMEADYAALITDGSVWIAEADMGALAGFIVFFPEGDSVQLETVAVDPAQSGRGVGTALIAFCETAAQASGARAVRLYTNSKMRRNLTLYPRLGYTEIARRHADGFDRVYFEKPLSRP